jgi:hypothetical protein
MFFLNRRKWRAKARLSDRRRQSIPSIFIGSGLAKVWVALAAIATEPRVRPDFLPASAALHGVHALLMWFQ